MNKPNSPFNWRENKEPTIFAKDPQFRPRRDGKSSGEVQSEAISRRVANGESPGSLYGISKKKEVLDRMMSYKQFGVYSRAVASKKPNKHEQ